MANIDIKWIKITTDIFDDEKIYLIEQLPDYDTIIVIWFKLLTFAGKSNNNGVFIMNNKIAYNDEMLSALFRRPLNVVRLALRTFEQYGMIEIIDNVITIPNWEKHQNIDGMEKIREQNRKRVERHREKQKMLLEEKQKDDVTLHVTFGNAPEKEEEKEKEKEEYNKDILHISSYVDTETVPTEKSGQAKKERINYKTIMDSYNEICLSYPRLTTLSEARKKAIRARLQTYSYDDFRRMFEMAEESNFMKGGNSNNWSATFDWMIKDANMAKILDGNYTKGGKVNATGGKQRVTTNAENPLDIATRTQMVKDGRIKLEDMQNVQGNVLDNEFGF